MGTIDDDGRIQAGLLHGTLCAFYIVFIVVGAIYSATKNNVGKVITCSMELGDDTVSSNTDEGCRLSCTLYSVDGCCKIAAGGVLEAYGHTETTGKRSMGLALCSTSSDTGPAHKLVRVLGNNRIKTLTTYRKTDMCNIQKKLSADFQTFVDIIGFIHIRICNKPLPTKSSPWLFEVCPHYNEKLI